MYVTQQFQNLDFQWMIPFQISVPNTFTVDIELT